MRCPLPVNCGLAPRADRLGLALLLERKRPLEHRDGCGLGVSRAFTAWRSEVNVTEAELRSQARLELTAAVLPRGPKGRRCCGRRTSTFRLRWLPSPLPYEVA